MLVFHSVDIKERFNNPVLTIGNYDGIHLGHRRIIERVRARAREISGMSMLMTFYPHPVHVLRPDKELSAITPLEEKKIILAQTGIEVLFIVPFTHDFSRISPDAFVKEILVKRLAIKGLVIGYDFRFGSGGAGDISFLNEMGEKFGFFVDVVDAITMEGEKVGSNSIRKLVTEGQVEKAGKLLGRPYGVRGTVIRAHGRGRSIGFPTLNLRTDYPLIPKNGVYVSEVEIEGIRHPGVTNIGYNPTFGEQERSIETFIMDFKGDLYDRELRVYFINRIRDEEKFDTVDALKARIARDVEVARDYFRARR
jgi:riboflavin kinase/FMN adenylyltransferase